MKMFKSLVSSAVFIAVSMNANAAWKLDEENSSVNFTSIKKEQVVETHHFKKFTGTINDSGYLLLEISLASVETGIEVRDKRMKEMLFEVADFDNAVLSSDLSKIFEENIKAGEPKIFTTTQKARFQLHGFKREIDVELLISYDGDKKISAAVTKPILIDAKNFGLEKGVMALQKVAGLSGITTTVPVDASLVFTK